MKKLIAGALVLAALLCGCGKQAPAPTTAPTTEPTTAPTTEPTTVPTTEPAPVYRNPLNGEILEAPYDKRIYAVTINNLQEAMPHIGIQEADLFMEMYVNGSIIRGLAVYTDPSDVPQIGSVRSTRFMFTQLAQCYDLVVAHAGGSSAVLNNVREVGIDNFSIDVGDDAPYAFRDRDRFRSGKTWDACLFAKGQGLEARAAEKGIELTSDPEKDYGLIFEENGIPEEGEAADAIYLTLTYKGSRATSRKETHMIYHPDLGRYVYNQYGKEMVDGVTGEPESFQNVIIMLGEINMNQYGYQVASFEKGGTGYYANGGRIIPITWTCEGGNTPFKFFKADGSPLVMGEGNTYIAITQNESPVSYEKLDPPPETTAETVGETVSEAPAETSPDTPQDGVPQSADEDYL